MHAIDQNISVGSFFVSAGIVSPLIVGAMLTVSTYFPLWASFATFLISAVCMCFLPIETKGRAAE